MSMAGTSWSSSCTSSFGSLNDDVVCVLKHDGVGAAAAAEGSVKFLCSYGGRIMPRHNDGTLRYVGGDNRVLSVDRPLRFYELQRRLTELCGQEVCLRWQLPTEDLDALVSVTSDDDLTNLLEEYDAASKDRLQPIKIRAFLFPRTAAAASSLQPRSSPPSTPAPVSRPSSSNAHLRRQNNSPAAAAGARSPTCAQPWWAAPQASSPARAHHPQRYDRHGPGVARPQRYLVQNGSHWQ